MGRNQQQQKYGEADLQEALFALQHGESYRSVERRYGIPRRTLQRHHKGQVRAPGRQLLGRFRQILDTDIEDIIANHALDMQQMFYGSTTTELRQMAFQVAEYKGVAHPFDHTTKMAGRYWLAGFLARNRTLLIREPATVPTEIVAPEPLPSSALVKATNLSERATLPDAVASTSTGRTTPVTTINTFVHGISPLPKAGPRLGKRRSHSAEHLTSSPYKDNLREKHQQLNEKLERQANKNKQTCKKSNKRELHKGKERTIVKHMRKRPSGFIADCYGTFSTVLVFLSANKSHVVDAYSIIGLVEDWALAFEFDFGRRLFFTNSNISRRATFRKLRKGF
ncbi:hypothetical protein LSAT2_005612 [Lamellibrachia satsuma]|nr:hypothetical protein LSAT2_005612 [Lamellibrachia satsuma]